MESLSEVSRVINPLQAHLISPCLNISCFVGFQGTAQTPWMRSTFHLADNMLEVATFPSLLSSMFCNREVRFLVLYFFFIFHVSTIKLKRVEFILKSSLEEDINA